ncbi:MAG: glycosyltransferase family 2 protein [Flavobacterium sp.]|nr:glycosyltransferase family 2 protein [Flavobacterium sp.]
MLKKISVVIPVYNEEDNICAIATAVSKALDNFNFEIIFVNDGSSDNSISILKDLSNKASNVFYISFSRNFGKDIALLAGLKYSKGDAVVTIDADLQHPPQLIPEMIKHWLLGNEVVYAYRDEKNQHTKKTHQFASTLFYKLLNRLSTVELEDGVSDFRLIDRKVVDVLNNIHEDYPFFRGLIKWVGFQQKGIPYKPEERLSGETKYSSKALLQLALQGITSFSTKPLGKGLQVISIGQLVLFCVACTFGYFN